MKKMIPALMFTNASCLAFFAVCLSTAPLAAADGTAMTMRSFHPDRKALLDRLFQIHNGVEKGTLTGSSLSGELDAVISGMEALGSYPQHAGKKSPDGNPVGGGAGYKDIIENIWGDYPGRSDCNLPLEPIPYTRDGVSGNVYVVSFEKGIKRTFDVTTYEPDFYDALKTAKRGDIIYIPGDAVVDITDFKLTDFPKSNLTVAAGVTIASDRGLNGSRGGVIKFNILHPSASGMFRLLDDVRLTGLVLQGMDPAEDHPGGAYTQTECAVIEGDNVQIDNCEVSGFSAAGFVSASGKNHRIHHNYFHHIRGVKGGAALRVEGGQAQADHNLFSNVRHAAVRAGEGGSLEAKGNVGAGNLTGEMFVLGGAENAARALLAGNTALGAAPAPRLRQLPPARQDIITHAIYGDLNKTYTDIKTLKVSLTNSSNRQALAEKIFDIISDLAVFDAYYKHKDKHTAVINGTRYGAYVEKGQSPIGGGEGYQKIVTSAKYTARTVAELTNALAQAQSGETVFISGGVELDLTGLLIGTPNSPRTPAPIIVPAGVTLASDRGRKNANGTVSHGAVLRVHELRVRPSLMELKEGARLTGITVIGASPNPHAVSHWYGGTTPFGKRVYLIPCKSEIQVSGNNVEIDNCEVAGSTHAGIVVGAKDVHIHHCYIHHCLRNGLGYGISHQNDSTSVIEYNLFNHGRHCIAATGAGNTGYTARFNIEMGGSRLGHVFDVHGNSGKAGDYFLVHNNTFLCYAFPYTTRGVPDEIQKFYHNIVARSTEDFGKTWTDQRRHERIKIFDNVWGIENMTVVP